MSNTSENSPQVSQADLDAVAAQLGREPRGVIEIAYRSPDGQPGVVKTAPPNFRTEHRSRRCTTSRTRD